MKNIDDWKPSKFVFRRGKLVASRDRSEVGVGSWLMADLVAAAYDSHLGEHARGRLIDLGCGHVPLYEAYKDHIDENICVDWGNTDHRNTLLDHECDLTQPLPFEDNDFDTIILSDVLEHIPRPENLWKEMQRIVKPTGKVLMNVPFYYVLHEEPHDYYRYTKHALRRFAENNDFSVLVLEPLGGSPEVLADIFAKHFQLIPLVGGFLASFTQTLTSLFLKTALGHKLSKKTGAKLPFGYFMVAQKNQL